MSAGTNPKIAAESLQANLDEPQGVALVKRDIEKLYRLLGSGLTKEYFGTALLTNLGKRELVLSVVPNRYKVELEIQPQRYQLEMTVVTSRWVDTIHVNSSDGLAG